MLSGGGVTETEAVAKADAALAASRGAFEAWAVGRLAGIEAKIANETEAARNSIALARSATRRCCIATKPRRASSII